MKRNKLNKICFDGKGQFKDWDNEWNQKWAHQHAEAHKKLKCPICTRELGVPTFKEQRLDSMHKEYMCPNDHIVKIDIDGKGHIKKEAYPK